MTLPTGTISISDINTEVGFVSNYNTSISWINSILKTTLFNWGTPGTYSWTVPQYTNQLTINMVGGGGAGYGYHFGGYGTAATPGGPGGGIQNLVLSVNPGDTISITVGAGGGSGYYNGGTGWAGTASSITKNGVAVATANAGNAGSGSTPGSPGSGSISQGSGTVVSGTAGSQAAANDFGYSVWRWIDSAGSSIDIAGIPPITAPSNIVCTSRRDFPPVVGGAAAYASADQTYTRAGRSEYSGWVSISCNVIDQSLLRYRGMAYYTRNTGGNCYNGNCGTADCNCGIFNCVDCYLTNCVNCGNCDSSAQLQVNCNCNCSFNCSTGQWSYDCDCNCNC